MPLTGRRGQTIIAVTVLLSLLAFAAFAVASWSIYNGHREACRSRAASLDVLRDILVKTEPPILLQHPGLRPLNTRERGELGFYVYSFNRIDKARC